MANKPKAQKVKVKVKVKADTAATPETPPVVTTPNTPPETPPVVGTPEALSLPDLATKLEDMINAEDTVEVQHNGEILTIPASDVTEESYTIAQYLLDSARTAASGFDVDLKKTMQLFMNDLDPVVYPAYFGKQLLAVITTASHADGLKRTAFYKDEKIQSRLSQQMAVVDDLKNALEVKKQDADFTDSETMDIIHAIWGIQSELGEIAEEVIRAKIEGREFNFTNLKEEAGDIMWYMALLLRAVGSDFESVAFSNISKLKARYPDKFTTKDAVDRDLDAELKALKGE